jgi:hypothetical protein
MNGCDVAEPLAPAAERISRTNPSRLAGGPQEAHGAEALQSARRLLPVTRWEDRQFNPVIRQPQVAPAPDSLFRFRTISEAPESALEESCGPRFSSLRRSGRSRAGVHFHLTLRSQADIW